MHRLPHDGGQQRKRADRCATGHSYQNGVCTVCGAREDVPAPVTPPKTGDSAHPLLWSVVLLAALLGAGLLCAGLRKRFR